MAVAAPTLDVYVLAIGNNKPTLEKLKSLTRFGLSLYIYSDSTPDKERLIDAQTAKARSAHTALVVISKNTYNDFQADLLEEFHGGVGKLVLAAAAGKKSVLFTEEALQGSLGKVLTFDVDNPSEIEALAQNILRHRPTAAPASSSGPRAPAPPSSSRAPTSSSAPRAKPKSAPPPVRKSKSAKPASPADGGPYLSVLGGTPAKSASALREAKEKWIGPFLAALGIRSPSDLVRSILMETPTAGLGTYSTTRLFQGFLKSFDEASPPSSTPEERATFDALRAILKGPRFSAASSLKVSTSRSTAAAEPSSNAATILRRAAQRKSAFAGPQGTATFTGEFLIGALVSQADTRLEKRLADVGIQRVALASALFDELCRVKPESTELWLAAFGKISVGPAIAVAPLGSDSLEGKNLEDKLGVADEARAFARVAAAKAIIPPLAFGVFGDWGSGKSFFMRLMHEHVVTLANGTAPEARTGLFHKDIVQIQFNAWHYVDSNLWASLVDHIFVELDRWLVDRNESGKRNTLFDRLTTARELTLESVDRLMSGRRQQKLAAQQLSESEHRLAAEIEKPTGAKRVFWQVVWQNFEQVISPKDLDAAAQTLGLDQLVGNAEALKTTLDSLQDEGKRASVLASGFGKRLLRTPSLILVLVAILVTPQLFEWARNGFLSLAGTDFLKAYLGQVQATVLSAAAALVPLVTLLSVILGRVRSALSVVEGYRAKLDEAIEAQLSAPKEEVKDAQETLAKRSAEVEEAKALLASSSDRLAEAARDYEGETGHARLMSFVRDRASDGQYSKHLGLVATVRKDFAQLSSLMSRGGQAAATEHRKIYRKRVAQLIRAARQERLLTLEECRKLVESAKPLQSSPAETFQRIVLYVDDLDRCPPDKVVEVLQAIHLLLTFPLFVVVVAVDVRWVKRSLEAHYQNLLAADPSSPEPRATANDYLEKIFQVPYWVRPMTADGSQKLLDALAEPPPVVDTVESSPESDDSEGASDQQADVASSSSEQTAQTTATDATSNTEADASRNAQPPSTGPTVGALELTDAERAFISAIAPWVGTTPRRALQFLNVYRVVKASLSTEELQRLHEAGSYRSLMTQIAIATGSPSSRKRWTETLQASLEKDWAGFSQHLAAAGWLATSPDRLLVEGAATAFSSKTAFGSKSAPHEDQQAIDQLLANALSDLDRYTEVSKRYSFGG